MYSKRMTYVLGLLLTLFCAPALQAARPADGSEMAVGQWRTHFSFADTRQVAWAGDRAYAVAMKKLYSYDPEDLSIEEYTMMNGLTGNAVKLISYNESSHKLLVAYEDGNFDLIGFGGEVSNIADFKDKSVNGSKDVNHIAMFGRYACVATEMGALLIDTEKEEIKESYILRPASGLYTPILDFAVNGDDYYLITADHTLYHGNRNDNLQDNRNWHVEPFISWMQAQHLSVWDGRLLVAYGRYLTTLKNGSWTMEAQYETGIADIKAERGCLLVRLQDGSVDIRTSEGASAPIVLDGVNEVCEVSVDASRNLYAAAGNEGLAWWKRQGDGKTYRLENSRIHPNGPPVSTAWKMQIFDGRLYACSGGRWGDRYLFEGGVMVYDGYDWVSLTENADSLQAHNGLPFRDIVKMAIDPDDGSHVFAASWGEGLYEFRNGRQVALFNHLNSKLVSNFPNGQAERYVRVDGVCYDDEGNLWMLNSDQMNRKGGIRILTPDRRWLSLDYTDFPKGAPSLDDILFTSGGQVWINSERVEAGLFVLDTKGTLEDRSDDRTRWISSFYDQDGKSIDIFTVHCVAEGRDGSLWIGTTHGPVIMRQPRTVFDVTTPVFYRVKVPRNDGTDEADYLLENSRVWCIAVDGADRKWIGTENDGAYLLSANGLETIHHFTSDNSPLPSDAVYSIAVHPETGEVFFGTEAGIVSFRSDATEGESDFSQAYAFPNPVPSGYEGDIVVTGLMEGSQVKVTDIRGHLIAMGTSLGGQYVWDGRLPDGRRAATGVYLVLSASADGQMGVATKIVVVK